MSENLIDLPDLKARAQAVVDGNHGPYEALGAAYREAANPRAILTLIGALEELELWRRDLLESAVVCEDGGGFVKSLIEEAKMEGITMDGRTLVAVD